MQKLFHIVDAPLRSYGQADGVRRRDARAELTLEARPVSDSLAGSTRCAWDESFRNNPLAIASDNAAYRAFFGTPFGTTLRLADNKFLRTEGGWCSRVFLRVVESAISNPGGNSIQRFVYHFGIESDGRFPACDRWTKADCRGSASIRAGGSLCPSDVRGVR